MLVETHYVEASLDAIQCLNPDLDSPSTLILVFSGLAASRVQPLLDRITQTMPSSVLAGCSTSGEIDGPAVRDGGLSVTVVRFQRSHPAVVSASLSAHGSSFAVGSQLSADLAAPDLRGAMVFSDGLAVNGAQLVAGLTSKLAPGTPVVGGLAGDGQAYRTTWVIVEGRAEAGAVAAVGLNGPNLFVGHGSGTGWDIFGPSQTITRSHDNVLYELDHVHALSLYAEQLGELARELPASGRFFPLAIRRNRADEHYLVRALLAIGAKDRSMTFAGDVPEGWSAQFMRASYPFTGLLAAATQAGQCSVAAHDSGVGRVLALAVSCVGRRLVLKHRTHEELQAVLGSLPPASRLVGLYSYGEMSPTPDSDCEFRNQSMTILTVGERMR